ncbi:MAG: peptidylprolyl isomerase [Elusimicrobiota bacterium]
MKRHQAISYAVPAVAAAALFLAVLGQTGCMQNGKEEPAVQAPPAEAPPSRVEKPAAPIRSEEPAVPARREAAGKPLPEYATATAPEVFKAHFKTTKGDFVVEVRRSWAPRGADRFYNLVRLGFFKDIAFFRIIGGFMAQFGIHGSPEIMAKWRPAGIPDDPVGKASNLRGYVTFAMAGPNTRTTQVFINFADNSRLDSMGFPPFGKVVSGMEVVDSLYSGYGESASSGGRGPEQGPFQMNGNAYLRQGFPKLDYIVDSWIE